MDLYNVLTFAEGNKELGKSSQYLNDIVSAGKLVEGVDYRCAGRVKLITREAIERIKNRAKVV